MEGRLPPDDDDLFEWTDAPAPPRREREGPDTGERELGTGEREASGTGEREPVGPWEPESTETGERDPLSTGERRRPVRRGIQWRRRTRSDTEERRRVRREPRPAERESRVAPPGRRSRHRDLPARVRRRQAIGAGAVAALVIVVLIVAVSGGGGGGEAAPVGVKRLVGQTIIATTKGGVDKDLVKRARKGEIGGVIVVPKNEATLRTDVKRLQDAASAGDNPPLLILVDQEGGDVKRLPGPPNSSPPQLGSAGDEDAAQQEGENTGSYLAEVGVNVDLAPLLDVKNPRTAKSIAGRTFGSDPEVVSKIGVSFIEGLQDGGAFATAKHFPGLGNATVNTDDRPVAVAATEDDLRADLEPFQDAVDAGVALVMVSTASYPTLGSKKQAAFSPAIVQGLLRDELGFDGVVITDDLEGGAVTQATTPGLAAQNALKAGDDLLLYAVSQDTSDKAFSSLVSQVKRGKIQRAPIEDAYDRITSLKDDLP
jgi:beta-N-acetylhexosaminidase